MFGFYPLGTEPLGAIDFTPASPTFIAAWINRDRILGKMKKNVASQVIGAQLIDASDGSAFTGSVTVAVTGDGGTQATGTVGSGACTHEGGGYHTYAPAQAETNYDLIAFTFSGSGAVPVTVQVYTSFPQTGDSYARIGAPAGASASADIAAIKSDSAAILVDTGTTLDGKIDSILTDTGTTLDGKIDSILADTNELQADDTPATLAALEASIVTISEYIDTEVAAIKAVTDAIPDSGALTTIDSNIDAVKAVTDVLPDSGALTTIDSVVDAIKAVTDLLPNNGALTDLATSTDLSTVDDVVDAIKLVVDAILLDTTEIGTAGAGLTNLGGMSTSMKAEVLAEQMKLLTTQMTESYATDGTEPTLAEALFLIQQSLHEFSISSTTRTVKKLDGSTTAATFTLNDATSPTGTTRAS